MALYMILDSRSAADLVEFEVRPVITSQEAARRIDE
jgi:hypothetical protein